MIAAPAILAAMVFLLSPSLVYAQPKEPIGRVVIDLRGTSAGLPATEGWTPLVPPGTIVPSRGLGFEVGGHVYLLRFRGGALGVGGTWLHGRGTSSPPEPATGSGSAAPPGIEVSTRMTSLAPQLSLNFGHALGFSYVSAGLGRTRVESEALVGSGRASFVPRESGWVKTLNFGGGARWFLTDRVGVGFDLRWHKLSLVAPSLTHPGAPRATLIVAGAGITLNPGGIQ